MGLSPPVVPICSPRAGSPQLRSRLVVTGQTQPEGVVPPSPGRSADLGQVRPRPRRSLRVAARNTLPALVLHSRGPASSGSRRTRVAVAGGEPLCVSPLPPDQSGSRQGQGTAPSANAGGPHVAQTGWYGDLINLSQGPPWLLPTRVDLLSQAEGQILCPQPHRFKLAAWSLNGSVC